MWFGTKRRLAALEEKVEKITTICNELYSGAEELCECTVETDVEVLRDRLDTLQTAHNSLTDRVDHLQEQRDRMSEAYRKDQRLIYKRFAKLEGEGEAKADATTKKLKPKPTAKKKETEKVEQTDLSAAELAALTGYSVRRLRQMARERKLPTTNDGSPAWRFAPEAVDILKSRVKGKKGQ